MFITIVELSEYVKDSNRLLDDENQNNIKNYLAVNPHAGELIPGTGGVRKLRWGRHGSGKSGGVRVIYYFYNETMPLFMLNMFAKNEKVNLTKSERNTLKSLTTVLVKTYGANKK